MAVTIERSHLSFPTLCNTLGTQPVAFRFEQQFHPERWFIEYAVRGWFGLRWTRVCAVHGMRGREICVPSFADAERYAREFARQCEARNFYQ